MYKTKITTRQDINVAIDAIAEAIEDFKLDSETNTSESESSDSVSLEYSDAELIVNTLEICANKFPDNK